MDFLFYLLKVSLLLGLFGISYRALLSRETFFSYNRIFLLSGIGISLLLPLWVFTNTVYVTTNAEFTLTSIAENLTTLPEASQPETFDWISLLLTLYCVSAIAILMYFFWQFLKVYLFLKRSSSYKLNGIKYIETNEELAPFSFLKNIVYNPGAHTAEELSFILKHEQTHARQAHTVDLLLTKCCCALLWFNPLVWWYSQLVEQNLELIADAEASCSVSIKKYQLALVKQATSKAVPNLTQSFYKSFLKTRVMMLSKPTSQKQNRLKVFCLLPFLALFLWSFNIKEERISRFIESKGDRQASFILDKHSTNDQIETLEDYFRQRVPEMDIAISGINRDLNGTISEFHFMTKYDGEIQFQKRLLRKREGDFMPYEIQYLGDGLLRITEQGERGNTFILSRDKIQVEERKLFRAKPGATESQVSKEKIVRKDNDKILIQQDQTFQYEIKPNTTEAQLEELASKMEETHRVRLSYSNLNYTEEGMLTSISLRIKDLRSRSTSSINLNNEEGLGTIIVFKDEDKTLGFTSKKSTSSESTRIAGKAIVHTSDSTSVNTISQTKKAEGYVNQRNRNYDSIARTHETEARRMALEEREKALEAREEQLEERRKLLEERSKEMEERLNDKDSVSVLENRNASKYAKKDAQASSEPVELWKDNNLLYLVDGEEISQRDLQNIKPEDIQSLNVYKDDLKAFGKKAEGKDGVIEITLKSKAPNE